MLTRTQRRLVFLVALFAGLSALSCTHPLGPGFRLVNRQTGIHDSVASSGSVQVQVADRLQSIGETPLNSVAAELPASVDTSAANLQVMIDRRAVVPQITNVSGRRELRTAFDPPWVRLQSHDILVQWDLARAASEGASADVSAESFFVASPSALPLWQTPSGIFTSGESDPDSARLTVTVPDDYRVLAPGKRVGSSRQDGEATYRFRLRPEYNFRPYVVAGRYQENVIHENRWSIDFWTFASLDKNQGQMAADRLASSIEAFADYFGPAFRALPVVHIVESQEALPREFGGGNSPGGESFPFGVLLDPRAFAQGIANVDVLRLAEYNLVQTWFGWTTLPGAVSQLLMGPGLDLFGWVIAAENRGPQERLNTVALLLARYDAARQIAPDKPLLQSLAEPTAASSTAGYGPDERITAGYKAALFFVALEDRCGPKNLSSAVRAMMSARTGDDVTYEDLKAAAEDASRLELSEMFREWLNRPGDVPKAFRERYGAQLSVERAGGR